MDEAISLFRSTREWMTPVMTESCFLETGKITPEEFVRAGDHLVRTCPSWKWETGDEGKIRSYLPKNKQFLSTCGVPSYSRAAIMQTTQVVEETVTGEINGDDVGWCSPALVEPSQEDDGLLISASDLADDRTGNLKPSAAIEPPMPAHDEYADMEDESLALDEATTDTTTGSKGGAKSNDNIVYARRYDVSITYDNYYRTPRIWLFGFNESGSPLSSEEVFQDIIRDYANKTVTMDHHPHLSRYHASIHPCQHASAMLGILQALQECGSAPLVEQYLFIFLKFIQSVVPTIEYDYTVEVQVGRTEDS